MQLCVSEYLFKRYPSLPEGKLSRLRAAMVCEDSFSKFAKECHFDEYIRLGKGEEKANARNRSSLLCDIFESLSVLCIWIKEKTRSLNSSVPLFFRNLTWAGSIIFLITRRNFKNICNKTVIAKSNTRCWMKKARTTIRHILWPFTPTAKIGEGVGSSKKC